MKTYFGNVTKYQNLLDIILSLALIFTMALAVSCQSQESAPAPYVPNEGTPLAPTTGEPEPPATPSHIKCLLMDPPSTQPPTVSRLELLPHGTTTIRLITL